MIFLFEINPCKIQDATAVTVPVFMNLYNFPFLITIYSRYRSAVRAWELTTLERGQKGKLLKLLNAPTKS